MIAGHTEENTAKAMELFSEKVLSSDMADGIFYSGVPDIIAKEYKFDNVMVNCLLAKDVVIVYPKKTAEREKAYAEALAKCLFPKSRGIIFLR